MTKALIRKAIPPIVKGITRSLKALTIYTVGFDSTFLKSSPAKVIPVKIIAMGPMQEDKLLRDSFKNDGITDSIPDRPRTAPMPMEITQGFRRFFRMEVFSPLPSGIKLLKAHRYRTKFRGMVKSM